MEWRSDGLAENTQYSVTPILHSSIPLFARISLRHFIEETFLFEFL